MMTINALGSLEDPFLGEACDETGKKIVFNASSVTSEYLSPRQLLEASLAGCLYITIKRILLKREISQQKIIVKVELDSQEDVTDFKIHIELDDQLDESLKQDIVQEAFKNSFVKNALSKPIDMHVI